jgi:2-polyprenyl-6-methoxyphenol hydroxylase-like FAD-dependent oxidoreductase
MKDSADILIVGAGPVGLLLATELRRDGLDVLLVDRLQERSFFCKALGVTARTLEIFEDLGIADEAIDAGIWLEGVTVFQDGAPLHAMDIPAHGLPYGALSLAQFETERLLEACLLRHGGAVDYGWALTGFAQAADGVRAQLQAEGGGRREIRCRWLVGCDGAHSKVRAGLGLSFEGGQYPQVFVLADVEVAWELPRGRAYRFNLSADGGKNAASMIAVPIHGSTRRYRLSTIVPETAASDPDTDAPDLTQVAALMSPLLPPGTELSAMRWSSRYRVSHRLVPSYGQGRVYLAGDAAHIHPPVGGQGMNTGLQDAHNLAWKLALAGRGTAGMALLDSYSAERHPVGLDVVMNTSRALNSVIAQQPNLPALRETQLFISYRDSPIVRDERSQASTASLAAGDRAPDAGQLERPFVGHALRLRERIGRGRHVLMGYVDGDGGTLDNLAELLAAVRNALGSAATGLAVAALGHVPLDRERVPLLVDAAGEFRAAYGAKPGMAWLVRPDGHIGWCSDAPSVPALESFLAVIAG